MLAGRWSMRGSGPDLLLKDLSGWQHSLVRRSPTGDWRFLIDTWTRTSQEGQELGGCSASCRLSRASMRL